MIRRNLTAKNYAGRPQEGTNYSFIPTPGVLLV